MIPIQIAYRVVFASPLADIRQVAVAIPDSPIPYILPLLPGHFVFANLKCLHFHTREFRGLWQLSALDQNHFRSGDQMHATDSE